MDALWKTTPADLALSPDRVDIWRTRIELSDAAVEEYFALLSRHERDRANRFTFFEGTLTHGVLDARNQLPGKRLPREPGLRLAIAVNFWTTRPWGVPTFGESRHYRALAAAPSRRLNLKA